MQVAIAYMPKAIYPKIADLRNFRGHIRNKRPNPCQRQRYIVRSHCPYCTIRLWYRFPKCPEIIAEPRWIVRFVRP